MGLRLRPPPRLARSWPFGAACLCASAAIGSATSCAVLAGLEDHEAFPADAAADADADTSAPPQPPSDAAIDAPADAPRVDAMPACPGTGGPMPVRVAAGATAFCIDATEVTVAQYEAFLSAKLGDVSGQPPACSFNTSYTPTAWPQAGPDSDPVVWVDECDAVAFCAWAGKRLCGAIDGGTVPLDQPSNANVSQWQFVCSRRNDGNHTYAYGLEYDGTRCNGFDADAGGVQPVGSFAQCMGGFDGVADMSGNVWEWEDNCVPSEGGVGDTDGCFFRGGSYVTHQPEMKCVADIAVVAARKATFPDVGIRCCSP